MNNQVLHILVPKGPNGMKVLQLANWSGKCFVVPRAELKELQQRSESNDAGLYFLFGEDDESTDQKLYIGESSRFLDRLNNHDMNKEFWNLAIIFSGGINKAQVRFLEYFATSRAKKANRYSLQNVNDVREEKMNEFDIATTQEYFEKIQYILAVLRFPVFQEVASQTTNQTIYKMKGDGFDAQSQLLDDGSLNVLKGSRAKVLESKSFGGWALAARRRFMEDGTLQLNKENAGSYIFTRDVLFKSPSAAAATEAGRSINGWTAWKDENGNTLDENLRK